MAKSVEKYLNKIANLIEESSARVGDALIKRIENMLNENDYLLQKHQDAHLIALAVFHELFTHYNPTQVISNILRINNNNNNNSPVVLPSIGTNDTFVAANMTEQASHIVQKGDICIRTDINKHLFNKTGRNDFISDWIDVSRVVSSEEHMLSINDIKKGDEVFRIDLDKTFVNITGINESTSDWREVVYNTVSPILNPSINPNNEHLHCNLNGTLEYVNLSSETGLFTPETYYDVIGDANHTLYIHSIYGDTAYGYMLSYDEDGPITQINYERIAFRNSKAICARHIKSHPVENVVNFVKSLPKNFPSDTNSVRQPPVDDKSDELFLPKKYYCRTNKDGVKEFVFIYCIFGDKACGYQCLYIDKAANFFGKCITSITKITLNNCKEERALYTRNCKIPTDIIDKFHSLPTDTFPNDNDMNIETPEKRTNKLLEYLQLILTNKEIMHNAHNLTIQVDVSVFDATSEDFDEVSRQVVSIHHLRGHFYEFVLKQQYLLI